MNYSETKAVIKSAPTIPLEKDTRILIDKLLLATEVTKDDYFEFSDLLFGLMSALSDVHTCVDDRQSASIVDWIKSHWDESNLEYIDLLVTILVNLSPGSSKPFIENKIAGCSNQTIKKVLIEGLEELR